MDALGSTSSIPTTAHVHTRVAFGHADSQAMRLAQLQRSGLPWICSKRKVRVTNDECRARPSDRYCRDCGIPRTLPKPKETQIMASTKGKCKNCGRYLVLPAKGLCGKCYGLDRVGKLPNLAVETPAKQEPAPVETPRAEIEATAEPSWDDFAPVARARQPRHFVSVQEGDRITMSVDLSRDLGWQTKQTVEVRVATDPPRLAIRPSGPYKRGLNYSLTASSRCQSLAANCGEPLAVLGTKKGKYEAERTSWGVVVHLDRPVSGKG